MARVTLNNVSKVYPNGFKAVDGFNLDISPGEFVVFVGPSGCGKSTTLRLIAGLEEDFTGTIAIGERVVNTVPPAQRDIAMVFQNYALYPHMTVFANMAMALKLKGVSKEEINRKVLETAKFLEVDHLLDRKPGQLSGGQRQRVALGRAIVRQPKAFLFDEPLSNLDARLRVTTRAELKAMHQRLKTTSIYVTHDQEEAMTLGDRIVVMAKGRIQQAAPPLEVYRRPANRFVAAFVGTPPMNFLTGTVAEGGVTPRFAEDGPSGQYLALSSDLGMHRADARFAASPDNPTFAHGFASSSAGAPPIPSSVVVGHTWGSILPPVGSPLVIGVRPAHLSLAPIPNASQISSTVRSVEPLGEQCDLHTRTAAGTVLTARIPLTESPPTPGSTVILYANPIHLTPFEPGEFGRNLAL